jgi:anaerobic selenocysteine-containing dehydrogenase
MTSFDGKPVVYTTEYDLDLFTYKDIFGGQSRTVGNYVGQMALMPENFVYLNALDARRLGLANFDTVRLLSPAFSGTFEIAPGETVAVEGKVKVIQGLRPGSVAISWSFGHWAYGARDMTVNGQVVKGEAARTKGLVPNPAMGVDGYLKDVCLTDPIAGDAAYSGTRIKLVKIKSGAVERRVLPNIG